MLWREIGGYPMPVDETLAWAEHFEEEDRRVGFDALCSHEYVSTVFLGVDYNFMRDGPPILYETMVFGGLRDGEQWRYADREAARLNHAQIVREITPFSWAWTKRLASELWWTFKGSIILEKYRAKMVDDQERRASRSLQ